MTTNKIYYRLYDSINTQKSVLEKRYEYSEDHNRAKEGIEDVKKNRELAIS